MYPVPGQDRSGAPGADSPDDPAGGPRGGAAGAVLRGAPATPPTPVLDGVEAVERHWTAIGLATGPADRDRAERGVALAYREAGLPPPSRIRWAGSPAAGAALAAELGGGPSLREVIRNAPWAARRAALRDRLGAAGWGALWAATGARSWLLVVDQVLSPLRSRLVADLAGPARAALLEALHGQHDAAWLAAFAADDGRLGGLTGLAEVARSCGWWWAYPDVAVLTERPVTLVRDNIGRLHRADGPAVAYPDGFGVHAWRGTAVPPDLAHRLTRLTLADITAEPNAEVRRVMLEHYGYERYLRESRAHRVGTDAFGTLWRADLPGDEPLVMVEVVNATPEPDGTRRTYWLRVPPRLRSPREAVAWTFGLTADEYSPSAQT